MRSKLILLSLFLFSCLLADTSSLRAIDKSTWMNNSACIVPLIDAFRCVERYFGEKWVPCSDTQQDFFSELYNRPAVLHSLLSQKEHYFKVSDDVAEVNDFLKSHHFSIQLRPEDSPSLYLASVFNIHLNWVAQLDALGLTALDGNEYRFVENRGDFVYWYNPSVYKHPVFRIIANNGDEVYLTKADAPRSNFDLYCHIDETFDQITKNRHNNVVDGVLFFPCVELRESCQQVKWISNLAIGEYFIRQAMQQTVFSLDEKGARAKSSFAAATLKGIVLNNDVFSYVIDEPFYVWIKRKNVPYLLFAAYCDHSSWRSDVPEKEAILNSKKDFAIASNISSVDTTGLPTGCLFNTDLLFGNHE